MAIINELQLSKDLIKFPSITPKDAGAINFLSKKLKKLGFKCKILEFKDKKSKPIKNLYARIAYDLNKELSIRKEDVFISLVEVKKENWSFGNGEAQYAK